VLAPSPDMPTFSWVGPRIERQDHATKAKHML
jgi:hypothetical protein